MDTKKLLPLLSGLVIFGAFLGFVGDRYLGSKFDQSIFGKVIPESVLPKIENEINKETGLKIEKKIVNEESLVIEVVEKASPSVVTIGIKKTQRIITDPFSKLFDPFGFFDNPRNNNQIEEKNIEQDIGTGFVVSSDGLIVTNRHVVADPEAEYKVISSDNKEYEVENIYRDPSLDMAILKISGSDLKPLPMGDSDNLKAGQFVVAIGTALGEFRNTVTTGVVSGLGRGITAGDGFYSSERLDNVIQTDAAINPGNSGGPLLNSEGQVIGVNVATTAGADNVSFAVPINVVKNSIDNFNQTGRFDRAFLGVSYKMISRDLAILNEIPEGAYIVEVVENSAADQAGIKKGDILTKFDGENVGSSEGGLAELIGKHKIGDKINVEIWRDGEKKTATVVLEGAEG